MCVDSFYYSIAYVVAIEQKVVYADEIAMAVRKARAKRWELEDRKRREEESDLYRYLTGLVDRDRRRQLEQAEDMSQEDKDQVNDLQDQRISQITDLFGRAEENGKVWSF
jgi:STIP1 family protein 1